MHAVTVPSMWYLTPSKCPNDRKLTDGCAPISTPIAIYSLAVFSEVYDDLT